METRHPGPNATPPDFPGWGILFLTSGAVGRQWRCFPERPESFRSKPMLLCPQVHQSSVPVYFLPEAWRGMQRSSPPTAYGLFCPPGRTCWCPEPCKCTELPSGAQLALSDAPQPIPRAVGAHRAAVLCSHGCAQGAVIALGTRVQAEVPDWPSTGIAVITWRGGRDAQDSPC